MDLGENVLKSSPAPLVGFGGEQVIPEGRIELLGEPVTGLNKATDLSGEARPSPGHRLNSTTLDRGGSAEEVESVPLTVEEQRVNIGTKLGNEERESLINFLRSNADVFAWSPEDMPRIDRGVMVHRLNVDESCKPVKQKRRAFNQERNEIVAEHVNELLKTGFIREVHYPQWISNVVLVKKPNGKWRMCIDFTDLNKVCPKDYFPLPRIDQLVDATAGHERLSFMDAYSGYNQIKMHVPDQEKTTFVTSRGLYCYTVMPFGLKNAGATYQRMRQVLSKQRSLHNYSSSVLRVGAIVMENKNDPKRDKELKSEIIDWGRPARDVTGRPKERPNAGAKNEESDWRRTNRAERARSRPMLGPRPSQRSPIFDRRFRPGPATVN
ncbi:uncharacterized protein LOC111023016 [Momordica charantia]|uniref:Uncharacterized protein LOC111023016 n=1 Tax=Momordica charantia TaxID=3673 RepID=A0A6J1DPJ5_MOMCH|nr:uncharacterized protein LOC111023016 [Momordica charantia]